MFTLLSNQAPANIASHPANFQPAQVLDIDIGRPLPAFAASDAHIARTYQCAWALIRLHTRPLGQVELRFGPTGLSADECARQIWAGLRTEILQHLREDGLPEADTLTAAGLPSDKTPHCLCERARLLANARFVSIVIATRNRPQQIARCLASLLALEYPCYEIVVVDNAPDTDQTEQVVLQIAASAPSVRYVREDRPGNAWARNRGLREARGEIVAFADDDVIFDTHWLAALVECFMIDPRVACVTGMILPMELETPPQAWIEQYGGFNKGFARRIYDLDEHRPRHPLYPFTAGMFGSGASMAFKTSVLRDLGGFDPAMGCGSPALGGEDLAAYFRVIISGHKLVYEPAAIVRHSHYRDYAKLRKQLYGYGVGLTAFLTKCLFDDPRLLIDFIVRIPYGLFFIFSPHSAKNRKKTGAYPHELTKVELKGMVYGPLAYLISRRHARRLYRHSATLPAVASAVKEA